KGIVFRYAQNTDYFWPVTDTVFKNTISCASTALDYYSSVPLPTPAGSRNRGMMTDHLVSSNTLTITAATNQYNSAIYLRGCGSFDKNFRIVKNRLSGGYAGVYIEDAVQNLIVQNNYFCASLFGLYREAMSKSDGGTSTTIEDNDGNQFLHNSVFTNGSCLYFGTSAFINFSQADWDIRNNILYTQNNSGTAACLNFQSNSGLNATDNLRYCNSNLFYNAQNDPGRVAKIGSNFYALSNSSWSAPSMASVLYVNNDPPNDANSFFYPPNWENPANCDLDLLPDAFWPFNYPNKDYLSASGIKFIYGNLTNTDITDNPSRTFATIGAFEAGSSIILPVTLIQFEAIMKAGVVHIYWQISDAIDHAYFEVEKSVNGRHWTSLGKIQELHGTSNFKKEYYATDAKPAIGNNYYRLKQVDTDGKFSYSGIRLVVNGEGNQLQLFPNPAKHHFLLSGLKKGMSHQILVMDIAGKLIHSTNTSNTVHSIEMPASSTTGIYLIQVDGKQYLRLVVIP
ncbi:MAG: T9SS type A sorting domain-containing protein, partial [Bacteroidetes bacterium]|nr:T9SS type A sorting domain-containing protein [Bacteroidota bacterium]